ncbi:unnamed protein product [Cutaneotrichosporon oleaginosum]
MPGSAATQSKRQSVKRERSPSESEDDHKPKKTKNGKAKPRPWTGEELVSLLNIALSGGASRTNFEGKVPGRTAAQCVGTWNMTVLPFLLKAVREKGDKKQA